MPALKKPGQLRIIGGKWRRRIISFAAEEDLRPCTDAIRETLFNWLSPHLDSRRCLDLFAGSGALGFESVSRGAQRAVLVENNARVIPYLKQAVRGLSAESEIRIHHCRAQKYLDATGEKFDIVFIDPPFQSRLVGEICRLPGMRRCLNPGALVYIESPKSNNPLPIPAGWHIIRESRRGMVQSTLIHVRNSEK